MKIDLRKVTGKATLPDGTVAELTNFRLARNHKTRSLAEVADKWKREFDLHYDQFVKRNKMGGLI